MTLYFITGNLNKLKEAKLVLGDSLQSIDLDLPEIQSMDPQEIISKKLQEAIKHHPDKKLFCEDVTFSISALNGFPGPLIKWWEKTIPKDKIVKMVHNFDDHSVQIKSIIGYWDTKKMHFFEGPVPGKIVTARGDNGWGFDVIVIPYGHNQTFAQMTNEQKTKISHRSIALQKLKLWIENSKV